MLIPFGMWKHRVAPGAARVTIRLLCVKSHPLRSASFTPVNKKCSSSLEENIFFSFLSFLDMIFFTLASWQKAADRNTIWFWAQIPLLICCMIAYFLWCPFVSDLRSPKRVISQSWLQRNSEKAALWFDLCAFFLVLFFHGLWSHFIIHPSIF